MSWKELMIEEMNKPYFEKLNQQIKVLYQTKTIFPPYDHIYQALLLTPLEKVKVVSLLIKVVLDVNPFSSAA